MYAYMRPHDNTDFSVLDDVHAVSNIVLNIIQLSSVVIRSHSHNGLGYQCSTSVHRVNSQWNTAAMMIDVIPANDD